MLALPLCKRWRHQASYSKRTLICPHEVFQVTKGAPQTILEVTSIAISTWASQKELYQIFRFGQLVFITRHSRLRAKPRAGIIALKAPGSVGTGGYVCMALKSHSPTRVLPDAHGSTSQNYHVHVPNTNFDSIQWTSLEPNWAKGRKAANTIKAIKEPQMNGYIRILQLLPLSCWCGHWFFEQCQRILDIVVDRTFPAWERCDIKF